MRERVKVRTSEREREREAIVDACVAARQSQPGMSKPGRKSECILSEQVVELLLPTQSYPHRATRTVLLTKVLPTQGASLIGPFMFVVRINDSSVQSHPSTGGGETSMACSPKKA